MRTWYRSAFLTAAAAFGAVLFNLPAFAQQKPQTVMVFKTATCGCCSKWVDHMKAAGFELKVQDVEDIAAVKSRLGVAPEISSCHTSQVGGYVIEGHVPASAVQRLLKERPKVAGLAVPGMPMGSPGMEVPSGQKDAYAVIAFGGGQPSRVYEKHWQRALGVRGRRAADRDRQSLATLEWLRQLQRLAAEVPFGRAASAPPYRPWLDAHRALVVYNEPGGAWMVPATVVWPIHDRLRETIGADDIAWIAATAGLPGECEGYVPCCWTLAPLLESLARAIGQSSARHADALARIDALARRCPR